MPTRTWGAVIAALSLGVLSALAIPTAASAHTGTLQASAICAADGTRVVTYSGVTTNVPDAPDDHVANLVVGDIEPAGATVSPATQTVVGNTSYSFTETVPGTATSASATAYLTWPKAVSDPIGTITFTTDCVTTTKDAKASVTVSPASCTAPGVPTFALDNATWDDATDLTDGSRTATANANHLFADGTSTATVTYTIAPQLDSNSPACATADAKASVTVSPPTCTAPGVPTFALTNAVWDDATDTTDGSRTATATPGHLFANGTSSATVTYTVTPQLDSNSATCATADATATVAVTPATCAAPGTPTFAITNAVWDDATDLIDGSRTATAISGHLFADGTSTATVTYTVAPQLDPHAAACAPNITPKKSIKTDVQCESQSAEITTTTTTPSYTLVGSTWVRGKDTVTWSSTMRPLTKAEIRTCPIVKIDAPPAGGGDTTTTTTHTTTTAAVPPTTTVSTGELAYTGLSDELPYVSLASALALLAGLGIIITGRVRAHRRSE